MTEFEMSGKQPTLQQIYSFLNVVVGVFGLKNLQHSIWIKSPSFFFYAARDYLRAERIERECALLSRKLLFVPSYSSIRQMEGEEYN